MQQADPQNSTALVGVKPVKKLPKQNRVLLAAWYVADGMQSDSAISNQVGVDRKTLASWQKHPDFKILVAKYRAEINERIMASSYALRENRIREANEMMARMKALILARAEAGDDRAASGRAEIGEETGLLSEMPAGRSTVMAMDAMLTREMRETLKYISQEMGQFQQKMDVTTSGQPITFTISMSDNPEPEAGSE